MRATGRNMFTLSDIEKETVRLGVVVPDLL